jgi:hypothetical protein
VHRWLGRNFAFFPSALLKIINPPVGFLFSIANKLTFFTVENDSREKFNRKCCRSWQELTLNLAEIDAELANVVAVSDMNMKF